MFANADERAQTQTNADFRLSEKGPKTQVNARKREQTNANASKRKIKELQPLSRTPFSGVYNDTNLRKILAPIKIKSALPPPPQKKPKTQNTPPPKRGILWTWFFLQNGRFFFLQASIKLAQPFPAQELRTEILWTRGFSDNPSTKNLRRGPKGASHKKFQAAPKKRACFLGPLALRNKGKNDLLRAPPLCFEFEEGAAWNFHGLRHSLPSTRNQRKTKAQQLKGKIVSAPFSHLLHTFPHLFLNFSPRTSLKSRAFFFKKKRRKRRNHFAR